MENEPSSNHALSFAAFLSVYFAAVLGANLVGLLNGFRLPRNTPGVRALMREFYYQKIQKKTIHTVSSTGARGRSHEEKEHVEKGPSLREISYDEAEKGELNEDISKPSLNEAAIKEKSESGETFRRPIEHQVSILSSEEYTDIVLIEHMQSLEQNTVAVPAICGDRGKVPELLGMIVCGFALRNMFPSFIENITGYWSSIPREVALAVMLLRAGIGLDPKALGNHKSTIVALTFLPQLCEATTVAALAHVLLDFPWLLGFATGFLIAAVSPAVVVPSMLMLQEEGYGKKKGLSTLILAAASLDDVIAISMFGLFSSVGSTQFREDPSIEEGTDDITNTTLFMGLLPVLEIAGGVILGMALSIFIFRPLLFAFQTRAERLRGDHNDDDSASLSPSNSTSCTKLLSTLFLCAETVLIVVLSAGIVVALKQAGLRSLGLISTLTSGFLISQGNHLLKCPIPTNCNGISREIVLHLKNLWTVLQPALFGLVGSSVTLNNLSGGEGSAGTGVLILILFVGLTVRTLATGLAVSRSRFNFLEVLFVAIAWFPKATVQAALASIILDRAESGGYTDQFIQFGSEILTLAFLAIVITAPIGALGIAISAPFLLEQEVKSKQNQRG